VVTVSDSDRSRLLALLAELLDYPRPGLAESARECRDLVAPRCDGVAALLDAFLADLGCVSQDRLEEFYSGAFDLATMGETDATCHPYIGHHLFGENYRRSRFMAGLAERYRAHDFEAGTELPDHVVVILRFLARCPDDEVAEEIVGEALLPALARMTHEGNDAVLEGRSGREIYLRVLEAARLVVSEVLWPDVPVASYETVPELEGAIA
jgi:nitrate reductase assembly molybdenum cofactor insertion protein NarJ